MPFWVKNRRFCFYMPFVEMPQNAYADYIVFHQITKNESQQIVTI